MVHTFEFSNVQYENLIKLDPYEKIILFILFIFNMIFNIG